MSTSQSIETFSQPRGASSDEQIVDIIGRLEQRYPEERISRPELDRRVRGFYRQFDSARIRAFVGVFVERLVRASIEQPA